MVYSKSTSQPIDREQVRQQLAALGYKAGDTVYMRAFYPSSDPRKTNDAGRKAEATNTDKVVELAAAYQAEGRGVYIVVNGGGHTDKDVKTTRAIFYEHDDRDEATQRDLWRVLGMPEPTFQNKTGGKSIHSYWAFDEPDEPLETTYWRALQMDLLEFADADRTLKNPSRVMRLAGAWHSSGNQSRIISNSGKRYSYDILRAIVPERNKPAATLFQTPAQSQQTSTSGIPETYESISLPVPVSVPLEACLCQASRDSLNEGKREGGRNDAGFQLASDLIGTADYLRAIGQTFDGDAESLFQDFGNRCNPALDGSELATIWKSADSKKPSPACKSEGVDNCVKGHYWNQIRPTATNQNYSRGGASGKAPKMPLEEAVAQARIVLKTATNEISANIKLEQIRQNSGMSDYSWEHKIIKPLRRDMDAERFKLELLALLQMEDAVERIRQIALLAPKYSMSAGGLKEAMSAMKSRTQTAEVQILSFDELWDLESEGIEWMVPELLPVGETVLFVALPKVGKSKAAVDLAFCVATGESRFLGRETKQGKVLLICPDASPQSLKNEMQKRGFRKSDSKNIRIIPRWTIDQMSVLEQQLEDFRPDLVIIDSLKKITAGKEISENSAEFADNIYELSDMISRYRASAILVHHASKSNEAVGVGKARGSTAIVGACWGMWDLERIAKPDPNNKKKMIADPKCPKRIFTATSRDSEGTSLNIEFNVENNSFDFISEVGVDEEEAKQQQSNSERLTNLFRNNPNRELSGPEIMELLGVERSQRGPIYNALGRMESKRIITSRPAPGDKRYNLYSLPNFNQASPIGIVPVAAKKTLPPPPPSLTKSTDDYNSETITQHGLENSHHNSHQLVITSNECDSLKSAEYPTQYGVDPIVITSQLSQGGGGVKCLSDNFIGTPIKNELAHSADPIALLVERVKVSLTWTEAESVWGDDLELKSQIKARLTPDECKIVGRLFKKAELEKNPITAPPEPQPVSESISPPTPEELPKKP